MSDRRAIVLAAGRGARLGCCEKPKAMYEVLNKPLLETVLENTSFIKPENTYIVVGYKKEIVIDYFGNGYNYVEQKEQLGTGHAVNVCSRFFKGFNGTVLVAFGDMPLFEYELNKKLCEYHEKNGASCTLLTATDTKRELWAHIIKDENGKFVSIVEGADCTEEQRKNNNELFAGILAFNSKDLFEILPLVSNENVQNEYYLTEVPEIMARKGMKICTIKTENNDDLCGVNTPEDIKICEKVLQKRKKVTV